MIFAEGTWVRNPKQPKRLGLVHKAGERVTMVQFGSSGPFENVRNDNLEHVSDTERRKTGYWGCA